MPLQQVDEPPPQTDLPESAVGRLGRLKDPQDPRDYQVARLLAAAPRRIKRQNARLWLPPQKDRRLNQGRTSSCVEHAITHAIYGHPAPRRVLVPWDHFSLYRRAQQIDEWPGQEPSYYGTSVRAGLQAANELWTVTEPSASIAGGLQTRQVNGPVESYWRVEDFDDLKDLLMADEYSVGSSIVMGTDWSDGMWEVDPDGFLHFDRTRVRGGHAWWLYHGNERENSCTGLNSWGLTTQESGMLTGGAFKLHLEGGDGLRALFDNAGDAWVFAQRSSALSRLARDARPR